MAATKSKALTDGQTFLFENEHKRYTTMMMKLSTTVVWAAVLLILLSLCISPLHAVTLEFETSISTENGLANLQEGRRLLGLQDYDRAAMHFWRAVMLQSASPNDYTVEEAFQSFVQCFAVQGRTADGFVYIAQESFARKQHQMGRTYLTQALAVDPNHEEALLLQEQMQLMEGSSPTITPSDSLA